MHRLDDMGETRDAEDDESACHFAAGPEEHGAEEIGRV